MRPYWYEYITDWVNRVSIDFTYRRIPIKKNVERMRMKTTIRQTPQLITVCREECSVGAKNSGGKNYENMTFIYSQSNSLQDIC